MGEGRRGYIERWKRSRARDNLGVIFHVEDLVALVKAGKLQEAYHYVCDFVTIRQSSNEAQLLAVFLRYLMAINKFADGDTLAGGIVRKWFKSLYSHPELLNYPCLATIVADVLSLRTHHVRASLDWQLVRNKAAEMVEEMAYKVPDIKDMMHYPRGQNYLYDVMPIRCSLLRRRQVKNIGQKQATDIAQFYLQMKKRLPSSGQAECHDYSGSASNQGEMLVALFEKVLQAGKRMVLKQGHPPEHLSRVLPLQAMHSYKSIPDLIFREQGHRPEHICNQEPLPEIGAVLHDGKIRHRWIRTRQRQPQNQDDLEPSRSLPLCHSQPTAVGDPPLPEIGAARCGGKIRHRGICTHQNQPQNPDDPLLSQSLPICQSQPTAVDYLLPPNKNTAFLEDAIDLTSLHEDDLALQQDGIDPRGKEPVLQNDNLPRQELIPGDLPQLELNLRGHIDIVAVVNSRRKISTLLDRLVLKLPVAIVKATRGSLRGILNMCNSSVQLGRLVDASMLLVELGTMRSALNAVNSNLLVAEADTLNLFCTMNEEIDSLELQCMQRINQPQFGHSPLQVAQAGRQTSNVAQARELGGGASEVTQHVNNRENPLPLFGHAPPQMGEVSEQAAEDEDVGDGFRQTGRSTSKRVRRSDSL